MEASAYEQNASQRERRAKRENNTQVLESILSELQRLTLHQLEGFGWRLAFVRRPLFQDPIVVVVNCENSKYGVLEDDGSINVEHNIQIRH
ncbi:hypothetical protein [Saccharophagus degradans]|uniref:Uncharacterized protein n=1 Tax=Saccharophagus degradans (strain 2-40 / ATCC 43961 / DSM 17024) TaxID=203122 RepID=Q21IM6_SACD2|nr:hypothetical protein [Saccharophagus degradans]ABD81453.1 hypothetical protein Sde_2193 [Saccharophagus degradans 2-40]